VGVSKLNDVETTLFDPPPPVIIRGGVGKISGLIMLKLYRRLNLRIHFMAIHRAAAAERCVLKEKKDSSSAKLKALRHLSGGLNMKIASA